MSQTTNTIDKSNKFIINLVKLMETRYTKLLREKELSGEKKEIIEKGNKVNCCDDVNCIEECDEKDLQYSTTSSQRYKEESIVLQILTSDTEPTEKSVMTDSFRPFFKHYYQMHQLLPDTYTNYFPFNKNNLPNKYQDCLDDILHDRINTLFIKIFDKPIELRKALRQLRPSDWIIMTFSRASIPLLHKAIDMYQCKPEHMKVLLSIVPDAVWYCPWHEDELGLTLIQALTRYIWYFNPKSNVIEQKTVHTLINNKLSNKFRFLKIKELRYDFDPVNMFNGLAWYSSLKISPEPDYDSVENVNLNIIDI
jgi:hypothetical protein